MGVNKEKSNEVEMNIEQFLKSNSCTVGMNPEEETGFFNFTGSLIDSKTGKIIKEKEEYTIAYPIEQIKNIIYNMMKLGVEYEEISKKDIGFGCGGGNDE